MSVKIKYFSLGTSISGTFHPKAVNLAYHGYRCEAFMTPLYLGTEYKFFCRLSTRRHLTRKIFFIVSFRYILRLN